MSLIRHLFLVAALYDGLLGAVFLFAGPAVFERFGITPPNHWGYIHVPAAILLVFALMFLLVAWKPKEHRRLIPWGMLLKLSYAGTVFGHHYVGDGVPAMWTWFAWADVGFLVLFLVAWFRLRKGAGAKG